MRLGRILLKGASTPKGTNKVVINPKDPHNNNKFSGMTMKEMKHHYAIIPMYGLTLLAAGLAGAYVFRLASRHPEVSWTKANPEPWNDYTNKQYKFTNYWGRDYTKSSQAPSFSPKSEK